MGKDESLTEPKPSPVGEVSIPAAVTRREAAGWRRSAAGVEGGGGKVQVGVRGLEGMGPKGFLWHPSPNPSSLSGAEEG